ncbi:MAG: S8 family serine peptidase [Candidatus Nanopelagicales bacterium]|nr:S8 family serine peptidase [Candidatus Nanopelagicales bacterium]MDZ4250762.1 S8 family serine peptidase [Candidatus Nanopelagicales bacterium]MDZ7577997.1 S8 family serine peptidase [Candidatus Nanopelagicales bacterium]
MRRPREAALALATSALTAAAVLVSPGLAAADNQDTRGEVTQPEINAASPLKEVPGAGPKKTERQVVVVEDADGEPKVTTLRADSAAQAQAIAAEMDARPGVSASVNRVFRLPETWSRSKSASPTSSSGSPGARRIALPGLRAKGTKPYAARQWNLAAVRARVAWRKTRGKGPRVAVIDTGVDASHPDLRGRLLPQINIVRGRKVKGHWAGDFMGHGTHVAGIIGADLNGIGITGVAHKAKILPVRVFTKKGYATSASVAKGIILSVRRGVEVINLSLGSDYASSAVRSAVAYATRHGVTVVAAAGNEAQTGNSASYPAAFPDVLAVSAFGPSGRWSYWSNHGDYIDFTAPGERIYSTVPGGRYAAMEGTSMAAPHVSAAATLVRSANRGLSRRDVEEILTATAKDDTSKDGWDEFFGHGLVRAGKAVAAARASR